MNFLSKDVVVVAHGARRWVQVLGNGTIVLHIPTPHFKIVQNDFSFDVVLRIIKSNMDIGWSNKKYNRDAFLGPLTLRQIANHAIVGNLGSDERAKCAISLHLLTSVDS